MISKDKQRYNISLNKKTAQDLDQKAKEYGFTKSDLISFAITCLLAYEGGKKLGNDLGKMIEDEIKKNK